MVKQKLKCWKELVKYPYWQQWVNEKKDLQANIIRLRDNQGYAVDLSSISPVRNTTVINRKAKTEKGALYKVELLMKKHDKC